MYAYLIKVSPGENNNKFYEMKDNEDGTFTGYWGRVGYNPQSKVYPASKWDSTYNSKLRKGYVDVTFTRAKQVSGGDTLLDTDSQVVRDIFRYLLSATRESVSKNYLVEVGGVTQDMIDTAQGYLNELVSLTNSGDWTRFNSVLVDLYTVLPRKMGNVRDYTLDPYSNNPVANANRMIEREQDTLDSLKGQVVVDSDHEGGGSLFDTLGLSVADVKPDEVSVIKQHLGGVSEKYRSAIRITNEKTSKRYDEHLRSSADITQQLLWHGSRNQNWISLLEKGLMVYPTNAIITGKMFGYGLYFAPRARKSLGYTSLQGSYWAGGRENRGYMGLFRVHTGRVKKYDTAQSHLKYQIVRDMGYDSVMGVKGRSLYNDEIIVYSEAQTDIQYLVELQ